MFADNFLRIREELNISQKEMSRILNISTQTISAYETGVRIPTLSGLQIIKEKLNNHFNLSVTYNDLLEGGVNHVSSYISSEAQSFLASRKPSTSDSTVDQVINKKNR